MTRVTAVRVHTKAVGGKHAIVRLIVALMVLAMPTTPARADDATERGTESEALFLLNDKRAVESSGLVASRQHRLMWTHNDAGHGATVFALEPSGEMRATVNIVGARAEDWEDIAAATIDGRDWIYIADVGDAYQVRKERGVPYRRRFEVVRFEEPSDIAAGENLRVEGTVYPIEFVWREGVNVEALAVRNDGSLVLVEKLEDEGIARVWTVKRPKAGRRNVPDLIDLVPLAGVSGADFTPDGTRLAIRTEDTAYIYDVGRGLVEGLQEPTAEVALPSQPQGEGVAFTSDGRGLVVSSEGSAQAIWFLPLVEGARPIFGPYERTGHEREGAGASDASARVPVVALIPLGAASIVLIVALLLAMGTPRRSSPLVQRRSPT